MRERGGREDFLLFAACLLLALLAYGMPRSWASSLVQGVRRTALWPVVTVQARAVEDRSARFRLESIQRERDSLAIMVMEQDAIRQENAQLHGLLELRPRLSKTYLATSVVHRPTPTDSRMLLIADGTASGVRQFDPLVTGSGLVGFVSNVSPASAAVMTWQHPDFRASVVTGDGEVYGVVSAGSSGEGGLPVLQLRGVALRDSLAAGTVVYTAGLGGVYPRGIPVGTIESVHPDEFGYERIYRVRPYVNPGSVTHATVLTAPRDSIFLPLPAPPASGGMP